MDDTKLAQILRQYLKDFKQEDSSNAELVEEALNAWDPNEEANFLNWCKKQELSQILPFTSYLFWLWRTDNIEYAVFEDFYNSTNQVVSKSWSMPIVITEGIDDPLFEGGFIDREFSVFQFQFIPSNRALLVSEQAYPEPEGEKINLDILLDFLSFLLSKSSKRSLGFRQIVSRKTIATERTIAGGMIGAEIHMLPDFDFEQIENALIRVKKHANDNGLTLVELLHVRHRAILDSNLESKLITLWSAIEAQWGREEEADRLITEEEREQIKQCISFLCEKKSSKVMNQISNLKSKTKNDKIADGISKLSCAKGKNVRKIISAVFSLRSKFAHGGAMNPDQQEKIQQYLSFMFAIMEELIAKKFADYNVKFS